jgi:FG-GAP-like repeat/IPT/TIG domain
MRALAVIATLLLATGTVAGPQFGPAREVAASEPNVGSGTELTMGDVNGDGIADAVIARITYPPEHITHPLGIYLGDGHGGYVDGSSLWDGPAARTEWGRQILIADFNGDGRNDIFVADHGYDTDPFPGHTNTLALSTPQGKLIDATANLPVEHDFSHSAAAADIDGDGDLDIFVGNLPAGPGTGPPEMLVNDGTGHFTRRTDLLPTEVLDYGTRAYTRSLFVDVNGDGAPDLVLGDDGRNDFSRVLLNDGTGHFSWGNALPAKPFGSNAIAITLATLDVNSDGHPDLLVGYTQGDPFYVGSFVQVLVNNGDGTFRDETATRFPHEPTVQGWPYFFRIADVNGDRRPDIGVVLNGNAGERGLLYVDDGTGVYEQVPFGTATPFWAFADANGDGAPDVFSVQPNAPNPERHFVQLELAPVVSSFSPTRGAPGTVVTVNGSNFADASTVTLGGTAVSFAPVSASQLTFVVPANAGSGRIVVGTPSGVATSTTAFSVAPTIGGFHPSSGVSGTSVTIFGSAFTGATAVTFGGTPAASFTVVSDSRITAVVAAGTTGIVRVTTASGSAQSADVFRLFADAPAVTGFAPSSGGVRSTVTVSGTHLDETTSVTLNGGRVAFAIVSATKLTFTVPVGAAGGLIGVSNPIGGNSLGTFTVTAGPSITSIAPASGSIGTLVTITGTNLSRTVGVQVGTVLTVPTVVTAGQVTFRVPPGAASGVVRILSPDGPAVSPGAFTVTP